mmetsp:Transcript_10974/g.32147  ORF Transcript_10974/g.32147 Transcript_10974/m.32147 type:complete len:244 (-) Transcript_10974:262-993(-)
MHVRLVAHKQHHHVAVAALHDIMHAVNQLRKGIDVGQVKHKEYTMGPRKVRIGNAPEPLVTTCIPEMQLHGVTAKLDSLNCKFDANRCCVAAGALTFSEAGKQAGLSSTLGPRQDKREQAIVGPGLLRKPLGVRLPPPDGPPLAHLADLCGCRPHRPLLRAPLELRCGLALPQLLPPLLVNHRAQSPDVVPDGLHPGLSAGCGVTVEGKQLGRNLMLDEEPQQVFGQLNLLDQASVGKVQEPL